MGVDQKGTSKEALEAILGLDINTLIFYQRGFGIFHPKIYLFEGKHCSQLIIGSSNLTVQGLFVNVEASIHVELNHAVAEEWQVIVDLKTRFAGLFDLTNPNLQPITEELIEQFVAEKIVPTEAERKEIREKIKELDNQTENPVDKLIQTTFPKRQLPIAPKEFRRIRKQKIAAPTGVALTVDTPEPVTTETFILVWQRRKLPASSIEIAGTVNTNPTGGLRLVQDKFRVQFKLPHDKIIINNW